MTDTNDTPREDCECLICGLSRSIMAAFKEAEEAAETDEASEDEPTIAATLVGVNAYPLNYTYRPGALRNAERRLDLLEVASKRFPKRDIWELIEAAEWAMKENTDA